MTGAHGAQSSQPSSQSSSQPAGWQSAQTSSDIKFQQPIPEVAHREPVNPRPRALTPPCRGTQTRTVMGRLRSAPTQQRHGKHSAPDATAGRAAMRAALVKGLDAHGTRRQRSGRSAAVVAGSPLAPGRTRRRRYAAVGLAASILYYHLRYTMLVSDSYLMLLSSVVCIHCHYPIVVHASLNVFGFVP